LRESNIVKVGTDKEILAFKGAGTKVIDLDGKLALPGFIDAHTHFENAVQWFFEALVMDVSNEAELINKLRPVCARVPKEFWISGTDFSAIPAWKAQRQHQQYTPFVPALADVDAISQGHPMLLRRYDKVYFANSRALQLARVTESTPDPLGGRYGKDEKTGKLNGVLFGTAGELMEKLMPPLNAAQKRVGARAVEAEFNRYGITSIHDIARLDAISQEQIYSTYSERSYSDVGIFQDLQRRGELSLRIYAFMPLQAWSKLADHGISPGSGDEWIRFGALKDFADGPALMFQPWASRPDYSGSWAFRFPSEREMESNIIDADHAAYDVGIHVLGDRAIHSLLNWYQAAMVRNGPRDRRFRLIHAWYAQEQDLERAGRMHVLADITPSQLSHNTSSVEGVVGADRAREAFAWRDMLRAGMKLDIGSDMPGLYSKQEVSPFDPIVNIHDAITRKWHPEQALTVEEAIRAYTLNPAFASHEESRKGSIEAGKLADLVVLSEDILSVPPEKILSAKVLYTILGGKIVYQSAQ
ncbi:MAG: amidohydrolase, partial [Acidobacteriaceae bacterium]|nr:amidohydrolase [Acidobacteriaceae bacterium]